MAITWKKLGHRKYQADCGGCIGHGNTPMDAINSAHSKWWRENEDSVASGSHPGDVISVEKEKKRGEKMDTKEKFQKLSRGELVERLRKLQYKIEVERNLGLYSTSLKEVEEHNNNIQEIKDQVAYIQDLIDGVSNV